MSAELSGASSPREGGGDGDGVESDGMGLGSRSV
jgi:hypothetical protein